MVVKADTTSESMVAPVVPSLLLAEAERQKVSATRLFRGLNIDQVGLEKQSDMISHRTAISVVRRGVQFLALGDDGLRLGLATRVTQCGILALGLLAAGTLGDAICLSLRYPQRAGYLVHLREEIAGERSHLIAEPFLGDQDLQDFLIDLTFTATIVLRRQVTGDPCNPSSVEFVRQAPPHREAYDSFFGCPVHFGCSRNVLSTSAEQLLTPLPWANNMAYNLSSRLLQRESEQLDRVSALGHSVERAVRRSLPRIAAMAEVAATLNLSERTLRRQLAGGALSYRTLVDDSRKSRALDLMAGDHRSIAQVAEAVGFADSRGFARAFLRWTGRSPTSVSNRYAAESAADQPAVE